MAESRKPESEEDRALVNPVNDGPVPTRDHMSELEKGESEESKSDAKGSSQPDEQRYPDRGVSGTDPAEGARDAVPELGGEAGVENSKEAA